MSQVRPDIALLWPSYTFFPLGALGILVGSSEQPGRPAAIYH